jgi:hypothetical protein
LALYGATSLRQRGGQTINGKIINAGVNKEPK